VIAVHPKKRAFYEGIFLFKPLGSVKRYQRANYRPAVVMMLDFKNCEQLALEKYGEEEYEFNIYKFFCGDTNSSSVLETEPT